MLRLARLERELCRRQFRLSRHPLPEMEALSMRMVLAASALSVALFVTSGHASAKSGAPRGDASASQRVDSDRPSNSLQRDFAAGGHVHLDLSAGEYRIVGASDNRVSIEWSARNPERLRRVRVRADIRGADAWVDVDGPDHAGMDVLVRVPRRSDLTVDLSAGEIHVEGIEGNKDIESYAGEVHVDVGRPDDYRRVHASVWAGEIQATAFNMSKDGLFRSFDWSGRGPYTLSASLWAGELRLYASDEIERR
jgi:hypothetical protein